MNIFFVTTLVPSVPFKKFNFQVVSNRIMCYFKHFEKFSIFLFQFVYAYVGDVKFSISLYIIMLTMVT